MAEQQGVPFHNKIFICDIVGYSRRDPVEQQECHALIVRLALGTLEQVGARLDRDVIALPTGDGVALNFKTDAPDIHLRTALEMLRMLDEHNRQGGPRVELRTGLNTHVDAIVTDVNGKENIVGTGINEAQRVMDLGDHAQVLLHKAASDGLRIYKQYQGRFRDLGEHVVKHGRVLSVVQYVDPACPFLNNAPPAKRQPGPKAAVSLADIRRQRVREKLLRVELRGADRGGLDDVRDYVSDFLDEHGGFQHLKIAVEWVASEMLDNAFRHGQLGPEDQVALTLDLTRNGILISTDQPVVPSFDLDGILQDDRYDLHFLAMMNKRGFKLGAVREHGRMSVSCELPLDVRIWAFGQEEAEPRREAEAAPQSGRARGFEFSRKELVNGANLLVLSGPLDHEALSQLQPAIEDLGKRGPLKLILDLAEVLWLPSVGIAFLVATESKAREQGGRLVLMRPPDKVRFVLDRMMLGDLLTSAPDLETAVRLLEGGPPTSPAS
jgi:anti-anti-sigma factor